MKRTNWSMSLAASGIVFVGFGLYYVLTDHIHAAAIDASLVAIVALILLAMGARR